MEEGKVTLDQCIDNAKQICDCDVNRDGVIIMLKTRLEKEITPAFLDFIEKHPDKDLENHIKKVKNAIEIYDKRLKK